MKEVKLWKRVAVGSYEDYIRSAVYMIQQAATFIQNENPISRLLSVERSVSQRLWDEIKEAMLIKAKGGE